MTDELAELSARYAAGADRRDPDLFASAFVPDGRLRRFDGADSTHALTDRQGHEALREVPGLLARYDHTTHEVGQARYALDGDLATGEVHCTATHVTGGERPQALVMHIRYLDTYRRVDGRWGIEDRRVVVDRSERRPVGPGS